MNKFTEYCNEAVPRLKAMGRFTNSIAIITDTGSDLGREEAEKNGILVLPLQVIIDGVSYRDGVDIILGEVFSHMKAGASVSTSMPMPSDVMDVFAALKKNGINKAVMVSISSGVSGTFGMFSMMAGETPDMDIEVFDSRQMSMAQGYIALEASRLRDEGLPVGSFVEKLSNYRSRISLYFLLPSLDYAIAGGRISHLAGLAGKALSIKPILTLGGEDGKVKSLSKSLGITRAYSQMVELVRKFTNGARFRATVLYAENYEASVKTAAAIKELKGQAGTALLQLGPTLSTHAGPDVLAVSINLL